jgi:THAP domain
MRSERAAMAVVGEAIYAMYRNKVIVSWKTMENIFFNLPKDEQARKMWLELIVCTDKVLPLYARLCSAHFLHLIVLLRRKE